MKTILIDLDDTVVDLRGPWVNWLNNTFGLSLEGEQLTTYWIEKCVPSHIGEKVYGFLNQKHIYQRLQPLDGGVEALQYLSEIGYDVMIATAYVRDPDSAADKIRWVKQWLPFIKRNNVFLCHRKELIRADCFIDDSPDNLIKYREEWSLPGVWPLVLTIDWPYNRGQEVDKAIDKRFGSYVDTRSAWKDMLNYIMENLPLSMVLEEPAEGRD